VSEDRSVFELAALPSEEVISYGSDPDQIIEIFRSRGLNKRSIGLIHGGYWRSEYDRVHLRPYAAKLAAEGFDTYLIEYRRIPGSPQIYIDDINAAITVIGECALVGHSAGGHLALLASTQEFVQSVVALAPVTDLIRGAQLNLDDGAVQNFLGEDPGNHPELDPMMARDFHEKVTIIHGDKDERVPVEFSQRFAERFTSVKYLEIPGIGHFEVIDPRIDSIIEMVLHALSGS